MPPTPFRKLAIDAPNIGLLHGTRGLIVEDSAEDMTFVIRSSEIQGADTFDLRRSITVENAIYTLEHGFIPDWMIIDFDLPNGRFGYEVAAYARRHVRPIPIAVCFSGAPVVAIVQRIEAAGLVPAAIYDAFQEKMHGSPTLLLHDIARALGRRMGAAS